MKCYVYLEFIYVFERLMVDIGCWFFGYFWWKMVFNLILIRYKVIFLYNIKLKIEINYIYLSNEYKVKVIIL